MRRESSSSITSLGMLIFFPRFSLDPSCGMTEGVQQGQRYNYKKPTFWPLSSFLQTSATRAVKKQKAYKIRLAELAFSEGKLWALDNLIISKKDLNDLGGKRESTCAGGGKHPSFLSVNIV